MKKIFLIAAAIVMTAALAAGCGKGKVEKNTETSPAETTSAQTEQTTTTAETVAAAPEIENEKPVRLYYMDYVNSEIDLITEYDDEWPQDEPIATFGAFVTDEEYFDFESEALSHQEDWDSVKADETYKIGYEISFTLDGEDVDIMILSPSDIEDSEYLFMGDVYSDDINGYMGVWLYDDYHQEPGAKYSHVTADEMNEDTLLTSIKLHAVPNSDEIENLKLRVFSYPDGLEFDEIKQYNDEYGYEISITDSAR